MVAAVSTGGGRPKRYKLANGEVVPGVTTINGAFKDPGPLMAWAHKLGLDGLDFRKVRDEAGDIGSLTHSMIDANIHGREQDPRQHPQAATAFEAFLEWRKMVSLEVVDTERPLVSELHRYGGTYDALFKVNGRLMLGDWKSSNAIYPEHVAQLAAYRQLIRENTKASERHLCPEEACLLRVGKQSGNFSYHYFTSATLDLAWDRFLASKFLYEADKKLKGAL